MSQHRKIVEPALSRLEGNRANYFSRIISRLETDPRADGISNLVYVVLRETLEILPDYLPDEEFLGILLDYVNSNRKQLSRALLDPRYVQDHRFARQATDEFVNRVVDASLARHAEGKIDDRSSDLHRFTWPKYDAEFPYGEEKD